jgi:ABC-2 type transport system ATP-binding protein
VQRASKKAVRVRSPRVQQLVELISGPDVTVDAVEPSVVEIRGLSSEQVGTLAAEHGIVLYELVPQMASLEEAFMELTRDSVEFHTDAPAPSEQREAVA